MLKLGMIAAVALAGGAQAAGPERWTRVGMGPGGAPVEIDRATLTWRSVQRAGWRILYAAPMRDGTIEQRHLELIDCNQGVSAVLATVSLGTSGQVISDLRDSEDVASGRMSPATPDTTGEMIVEQACRLRPPPPPPRPKRR